MKFNLDNREKNKDGKKVMELFKQDYKSTFDYAHFEVNEEKEDLIECERSIKCNLVSAFKNIGNVAFFLAEAKSRLSNGNKGTFMAWYLNLGLSKDFVSFTLMKYNLALAYKQDVGKIMCLTNEMIKRMVGKNSIFTQKDIEAIVNSDDVKETYNSLIKTKSMPDFIEYEPPKFKQSTVSLLRINTEKIQKLKPNQLKKANNYLLKIEESYEKLTMLLEISKDSTEK